MCPATGKRPFFYECVSQALHVFFVIIARSQVLISRKLALYVVKYVQFNPRKNILIGGKRTQVFYEEQLTELETRMKTKEKASKKFLKW